MRVPHFPYSIFMLCSYKGYADKAENRNKRKTGNIYRGVGLCGVKNAVEEQFEGSISVDSEEGRGTKFHIEIPIAKLEEIE